MKKYLLVDDDPIVDVIHQSIIKKVHADAQIEIARTGLEALENLMSKDLTDMPDIIFLDINMPKMNGFQFLDRMLEERPEVFNNTRVFILSSSMNPVDMSKSYTYSVVDKFVSKPLTVELIKEIIGED